MAHHDALPAPRDRSSDAITIVDRVPGRPLTGRTLNTLRAILGYLLIAVAIICAIPALALLVGLALAIYSGDGAPGSVWLAFGGFTVASFLLLRLGLRVARGRRHLVIFLRRFGFNDASVMVTHAVTGAMGRRWRLVTLDDTQVEAVGTRTVERIVFSLGRWVLLGAFLVAVLGAARWLMGDGIGSIISGIFDDSLASAEAGGANAFEAIVGAFFAALLVGIVVVAMIVILGVLAISGLGVAGLATWTVAGAIRRAEGSKALRIDTASTIESVVDRIKTGTARIQAPRLVVVKVDDAVWREVVRALSEEATVAVVDISDPSDHLVWEIALLKGAIAARLLLIGRRDRVETLVSGRNTEAAGERLRGLLAGEEVLVYEDGDDRRSRRHFARNLARQLNRIAP